jgi:hypothetical protein
MFNTQTSVASKTITLPNFPDMYADHIIAVVV